MNQTTMDDIHAAVDLDPPRRSPADSGVAQSLWQGDAGTALAHCELAAGTGDWTRARAWINAITSHQISVDPIAGMFAGVPAVAAVLSAAGDQCRAALDVLLDHVVDIAHHRLDAAFRRIRAGRSGTFAEWDVLRGLTGIGRLLLHCRPGDDSVAHILDYLVALSKPITVHGRQRPGWWVDHHPDPLLPTPGGHDNLGLAHGIAGPLALLSIAHRDGLLVDGHTEAIERISRHLINHTIHNDHQHWWPQWMKHDGSHPHTRHPPRPSWCYGSPGIARALQLAAIATGDTTARRLAENAIVFAITNTRSITQLTEPGLCHGSAGTYLAAWHLAQDTADPRLTEALPNLARTVIANFHDTNNPSLLEGAAGAALAAHHVLTDTPSATGWEQCLLLT